MGKIQLKSLEILCDGNQTVYRPGDVITGCCVIQLAGELNLNHLVIKLIGCAQVRWVSMVESGNESQATSCFANDQFIKQYCFPDSGHQTVITSGVHKIGFNFQLPNGMLPSSYEGTSGYIRYWIEAKIIKPELLSFDHKTSLRLTIQSPAFASIQELSSPVTISNHKMIGIFDSGAVSMKCNLGHIGHNIGTYIPINCSIDNQSKKATHLRATLKQEVDYTANGSHQKSYDKMVRVLGSTIAPFSKSDQILTLLVPNTIPIVHNSCPIIKIKYTIIVTLGIPGSFDLHCDLPVIITNQTLPFDDN